MTDLPTLAAILLANFCTVRIPRYESLWTDPVSGLPLELHSKLLPIAMAGETMIAGYHRLYLRQRLLDNGHRAFFDRIEGGGPSGWRLHFFCLDPSAVTVLNTAGGGYCGSGDPVTFHAEEFVMLRLRELDRSCRLDKPKDWWWYFA